MEELLTVSQASRLLQISASLVYSLVATGKLSCYRLGNDRKRGAIRFSFEKHIEPYLDSTEKRDSPKHRSGKKLVLKNL